MYQTNYVTSDELLVGALWHLTDEEPQPVSENRMGKNIVRYHFRISMTQGKKLLDGMYPETISVLNHIRRVKKELRHIAN